MSIASLFSFVVSHMYIYRYLSLNLFLSSIPSTYFAILHFFFCFFFCVIVSILMHFSFTHTHTTDYLFLLSPCSHSFISFLVIVIFMYILIRKSLPDLAVSINLLCCLFMITQSIIQCNIDYINLFNNI